MKDPEELLDIHEAARLLRVSETSLRRWTNSGALPHLRIGRKRERRFRRGDLLAFLEAAPRPRPVLPVAAAAAVEGFGCGPHPAEPGTHLCGLYSGESVRVEQAAQFLADGLLVGSHCILLTTPKSQRAVMAEVARRARPPAAGSQAQRVAVTEYAPSIRAQLRYFETEIARAVHAGAERVYIVGDLSGGGPARSSPLARILAYERDYDRRIARRFPVVTLCQYDARKLSGTDLYAVLQCHPGTPPPGHRHS
jgi:excisionase family DNA binding protein